jgi:hypothetical protein
MSMNENKPGMKSSTPLRAKNFKPRTKKKKTITTAPEVPPLKDEAAEPKGHTKETLQILKTFDQFDFVRICALPIVDLGISNPADMWAKDFNDLAKRCRGEIIKEDGEVKECWVHICNNLQDSTPIMTPEILAVAVCKIAGWKAFLRDVDGKVD